jgi:hypothetical protein
VAVLVGSTRVGTIDLRGARARRTYALPAFATRTAKVTVKVLSDGKPVKVDALGLSAG